MVMYENKDMLSWLGYFADMMKVSPEKIKMLNICGKQAARFIMTSWRRC